MKINETHMDSVIRIFAAVMDWIIRLGSLYPVKRRRHCGWNGGLSPELCEELETHLTGCDNCRVVLNTTRRTIDLVHTPVEKPDLPDDVRERLFKRLNLDDYLDQIS